MGRPTWSPVSSTDVPRDERQNTLSTPTRTLCEPWRRVIGHVAQADLGFPLQLEDRTIDHTEAQINWGDLRYHIRRFSDGAGHSKGLEVFS